MVVALDQQHIGAQTPGRNCRRGPRRSATDNQHVSFAENRNFARGLGKGLRRSGTSRPTGLAEQLETLFRADSLAAGLTAGAVSENLRLPYRSPAYLFGFVTAHLRRIPFRSFRIGCDASTVRMLRGALIFKRVSIGECATLWAACALGRMYSRKFPDFVCSWHKADIPMAQPMSALRGKADIARCLPCPLLYSFSSGAKGRRKEDANAHWWMFLWCDPL